VLIKALVADLILHKNQALVMDMEAGIEHLGRGTARGVDVMVVVVEPGGRSIDSARRILSMAGDIGLGRVRFVANKLSGAEDERFVGDALAGCDILGCIPYSERLRQTDRGKGSVLDGLSGDEIKAFDGILRALENSLQP
jgi:CO dehydrogenase maturation factor